jgi:ADP-heptose:LPS heptosyltransferase
MKKIYINLAGGIGNIIQTIPFALHMKSKGYSVIGINKAVDFEESLHLLFGIYDDVVDKNALLHFCENTLGPCALRYNAMTTPEWAGWFVSYNIPVPEKVLCSTNSEYIDTTFDICICPTCKDNWPMKKYPYWNELAKTLAKKGYSVGIVGQLKDGNDIDYGNGVYDARGFTLLQVAYILRNSKFNIANEGGLAHLSAAQGTKTYILLGGSSDTKNMPPNNAEKISINLSCQPCQLSNLCYVNHDVEPPIFYGCSEEEYKQHKYAKCLRMLEPDIVLKHLNIEKKTLLEDLIKIDEVLKNE